MSKHMRSACTVPGTLARASKVCFSLFSSKENSEGKAVRRDRARNVPGRLGVNMGSEARDGTRKARVW